MSAVFKREFKSYFQTPVGYIVLAVYSFFLSFYFSLFYSIGSSAIEDIFGSMHFIEVFTMPVITMRLISDESRNKTDQILFTSPVKISSIVLGKFFAAFCLYILCLSPTVIFEVIIQSHVKISILPYLYSLLGSLLLGGALIAIGMFISSLTDSVVIAAIITLLTDIVVLFAGSFASVLNSEKLANLLSKIAFIDVASHFSIQVFSIPDIVYFLSIIVAFLFLSVRSIERKRWA